MQNNNCPGTHQFDIGTCRKLVCRAMNSFQSSLPLTPCATMPDPTSALLPLASTWRACDMTKRTRALVQQYMQRTRWCLLPFRTG
jgi:hypothetical protein